MKFGQVICPSKPFLICLALFFLGVPLLQAGLSAQEDNVTVNSSQSLTEVNLTPLEIGSRGNWRLTGNVEFLRAEPETPLQEIRKRPGWQKPKDNEISLGTIADEVWVRFKLVNNSNASRSLYVQQSYTNVDLLEFFRPIDSGVWEGHLVGDAYPFINREVPHRTMVFPITLEAGESKLFYMRAYTPGAMILDLNLWEPRSFFESIQVSDGFLNFFYGMMLVIVLYNMLIAFSTRQMEYVYYIGTVFFFTMSTMLLNGHGFQYIWPDYPYLNNKLVLVFFGLFWFCGARFSIVFLDVKNNTKIHYRLMQVSSIAGIVLVAVSFVVPYRLSISLGIIGGITVAGHGLIIGLQYSIQKKPLGLVYFLSWSSFLVGISVFLLRVKAVVPDNIFTQHASELGASLQVVLLSFGLAERLNILRRELAELNEDLENRVKERTEELQTSLGKVQELKHQQDGDYFLTSLLLKPLQIHSPELNGQNKPAPFPVTTSFLNEPYKKFEFRKRKAEIGGDYCTTEQLRIGGREYMFFINADAMGKSIQGAGGALVLGTYIKSILGRTKLGKAADNVPELWLRTLYKDLQELFESFEGSMLISLVAGLVDLDNGTLYFFNSEHPKVVLYRDSSASFLDIAPETMKIGAPLGHGSLQIAVFKLLPGDIIVIGSDGRDEVIFHNSNGDINDDEKKFLRWVEQGQGIPGQIVAAIKSEADVRDDLSIMNIRAHRISHSEKIATVEGHSNGDIDLAALKSRANKHRKSGDYHALSEAYFRLYSEAPDDPTILYNLSATLFNLRKYGKSFDYALAQNLRRPLHGANLVLLVRLCRKIGLDEKSKEFLTQLEAHFPEQLEKTV